MIESDQFFAKYLSPGQQQSSGKLKYNLTPSDARLLTFNISQIRLSPQQQQQSDFHQKKKKNLMNCENTYSKRQLQFDSNCMTSNLNSNINIQYLNAQIRSLIKSGNDLTNILDRSGGDHQFLILRFKIDVENVEKFMSSVNHLEINQSEMQNSIKEQKEQLDIIQNENIEINNQNYLLNQKCQKMQEELNKSYQELKDKDLQIENLNNKKQEIDWKLYYNLLDIISKHRDLSQLLYRYSEDGQSEEYQQQNLNKFSEYFNRIINHRYEQQIDELNQQYSNLQVEMEILNSQNNQLNNQIKVHKTDYEELQLRYIQNDQQKQKGLDVIRYFENYVTKLENQRNELDEKQEILENQVDDTNIKNEQINKQLQQYIDENKKITIQYKELELKNELLNQSNQKLINQMNQINTELIQLNQENQNLLLEEKQNQDYLKNNQDIYELERENWNNEMDILRKELDKYLKQYEQQQQGLINQDIQQKQIDELNRSFNYYVGQCKFLSENQQKLQYDNVQLELIIQKLQLQLDEQNTILDNYKQARDKLILENQQQQSQLTQQEEQNISLQTQHKSIFQLFLLNQVLQNQMIQIQNQLKEKDIQYYDDIIKSQINTMKSRYNMIYQINYLLVGTFKKLTIRLIKNLDQQFNFNNDDSIENLIQIALNLSKRFQNGLQQKNINYSKNYENLSQFEIDKSIIDKI